MDEQASERETLFITDAELIRRLGVPEKIGYDALRMLDANPTSGFPKKQQFWGNRRYWPAILAYLETTLVPKMMADAARPAAESRDRTRLPRHPPAVLPLRRST